MNLFNTPSTRIQKYLKASAWDEDKHPRDKDGKFRTAAGVAAGAAAAGLVGAAAAGVPGVRSIVPGVRRAVLATRIRAARAATNPNKIIARAEGKSFLDNLTTAGAGLGILNTGRHSRRAADAVRTQLNIKSPAMHRRLYGGTSNLELPTRQWLARTQERLGSQRGSLRVGHFNDDQQRRIVREAFRRHGTVRDLQF